MSNESEPKKVSRVFGPCVTSSESSLMVLLSVFVLHTKGYEFAEQELTNGTKLDREDVLSQVALLEGEGFVKSSLEKGSDGKWQRLYSLANDVTIKIILEHTA